MVYESSQESGSEQENINSGPKGWNWSDQVVSTAPLSPISGASSNSSTASSSPPYPANAPYRRGRPKSEAITTLILKGSSSESSIKCTMCCRVFPRLKSLRAHLRTHTGERPYVCDFPGCGRAFAQSGQLKTHQRLHTGEKPFICSVRGCANRFTHSNRHCPKHPYAPLERDATDTGDRYRADIENTDKDVLSWLDRYYRERTEKLVTKTAHSRKQTDVGKTPSPPAAISTKRKVRDSEDCVLRTPEKEVAFALLELSRSLYKQEGAAVNVGAQGPPSCRKAIILE